MFSFMISEFLTSIIFREGEHPVSYLGPHTTVAWLAGRAGCWPACHLIGPFLVVILSLRMESHSPTTTFQPKWKRDFFSPMPLPSTSLRGQPKTPSYWPTYYVLRSELMFEFFLESLISTPVSIVIHKLF